MLLASKSRTVCAVAVSAIIREFLRLEKVGNSYGLVSTRACNFILTVRIVLTKSDILFEISAEFLLLKHSLIRKFQLDILL